MGKKLGALYFLIVPFLKKKKKNKDFESSYKSPHHSLKKKKSRKHHVSPFKEEMNMIKVWGITVAKKERKEKGERYYREGFRRKVPSMGMTCTVVG